MDFRTKFYHWMAGRNGMDAFAKFESWVTVVLLFVSLLLRSPILNIVTLVLIGHMYFRIFSRNLSKRYQENQKYLTARYRAVAWMDKRKKRIQQRKNYRFYHCPQCKQEVRVPKGHGKICITCPKCRNEFIRRS